MWYFKTPYNKKAVLLLSSNWCGVYERERVAIFDVYTREQKFTHNT